MKRGQENLRICDRGHEYFKSSDCPVCPICAAEEKPKDGFLSLLTVPARRALEGAGITTLQELSKLKESEILKLHGMGQSSIPKLRNALSEKGMSFNKGKI